MSLFSKLRLAFTAIFLFGVAVAFVLFIIPMGQHTSPGTVVDYHRVGIRMVKGGETLSQHDAYRYDITIPDRSEPVVYQAPALDKPQFERGRSVTVTWSARGLIGRPLVSAVQ